MRRLALAALILLASVEARAADQFRSVSLSGAGLTSTDAMIAVCDTSHVVTVDRSVTSGTGAGRIYTQANGTWSVASFDLPSPSVTFGHANMLGCNGTNIVTAGGAEAANGTEWIAFSTIGAPGTWTIRRQQTDTGYTTIWSGIAGVGPGAKEWTVAGYYDPGNDHVLVQNMDIVSALSFGNSIDKDSGGENFTYQCSGAKVGASYYMGGCVGNNTMYLSGFDGTTTKLFDSGTLGTCTNGPATSNGIVRQAFAFNGLGILTAYNSTSARTYFCGATSAASKGVDQNITSADIRPGVDFTFPAGSRAAFAWSTAGVAYIGGGSAGSYFSNESGTTHDITCDSGTVIGVVGGTGQALDTDNDGDSTDNLLALCTSGNAQQWGEVPTVASSARPRQPGRIANPALRWVLP